MQFTVAAVAAALGKTKQAVQKDIITKCISTSWDETANPRRRMIDASEIIRVYGIDMMLPPSKRQQLADKDDNQINEVADLIKAKDEMIAVLKEQLVIKDEQIQNYSRLLAAPKPENDPYAAILERLEAIEKEVVSSPEPTVEPPRKGFWARLVG